MARYCTECGGKLEWDRKLRQYSCQSCGLSFTQAELSAEREKLYSNDNEDDKRQQKKDDYLNWWFDKKQKP